MTTSLPGAALAEPTVEELLDLDREFRTLPSRSTFIHTSRAERRYTVLYSHSPLALRMGRARDWVIIDLAAPGANPRWTVVTERRGVLAGKRVVRGREVECFAHYRPDDGGHGGHPGHHAAA